MYTVNIRATKICRDKYYRLSFLWCLWEKDSDREKEIERLKERQKNRQPDGQTEFNSKANRRMNKNEANNIILIWFPRVKCFYVLFRFCYYFFVVFFMWGRGVRMGLGCGFRSIGQHQLTQAIYKQWYHILTIIVRILTHTQSIRKPKNWR